jgi:hypothetical protein
MLTSYEETRRLSPSAAIAIAVAAACAFTSCIALLSWSLSSGATLAIIVPLLLAPVVVALAAWAFARLVIRAELGPIAAGITRLEAQDYTTPNGIGADETRALVGALERCRLAMPEKQRPARAHAAVARLLGTAIGRLAEGDIKARITLDLPEPYQAARDDFNAAMDALEKTYAGMNEARIRLADHAAAISTAAEHLSKRAGKLAERLDADTRLIDSLATGEDPLEGLRAARHTMGGVAVATHRNIEAAREFASLAAEIAQEAARLGGDASSSLEMQPASQGPQNPDLLPEIEYQTAPEASALRLHG